MKSSLSDKLLAHYDKSNYIIIQKVKVIHGVCVALLFLTIIYFFYLLNESPENTAILVPIIFMHLLMYLFIYLLYRGYFSFVAHFVLIAILTGTWIAIFLDKGEVLQRLDSVLLVMGILALSPLVIVRRGKVIFLYYGLNILVLYVIVLSMMKQGQLLPAESLEFLLDATTGFLFSGIVSFHVHKISINALIRQMESANEMLLQRNELEQVNEQLQASMEELEATNEAFERQNQELLEAQHELKDSENRFKILHEASSGGIGIHDKGMLIDCNQGLCDLTGYSYDELIGMNGLLLIAEDFRDIVMKNIMTGYEEPYDAMGVRKDGTRYYLEILGKQIPYHGAAVRVTEFRDITARKEAEIALQKEKEQLAVTLRSIGDGVITTDLDGRVALINGVAEVLTGFPQEEAVGRHFKEIFRIQPRGGSGLTINPVELVIQSGNTVNLERDIELIGRDGIARIIEDSAAPIKNIDGGIIGVVLVFRDVTRRDFIEKELNKMQQLESLGVLAGGIAHDFNNILSSILGNVSLAKLETMTKEERLQCINDAEKAAIQARHLTSQLLTFSRGGMPVRETAEIKDIITDSVNFSLSGSNVKCQYEFSDNLWHGVVDKAQISQVIQNLVINAKQSMPGGGLLHIQVENLSLPEQNEFHLYAGDYLKISIRDQGEGIPRDLQARIFDPYFSTKKKGHGLGLSVVYSVVTKHDGYVTVDSEPGKGTMFTIYLPATKDRLVEKKQEDAAACFQSGKILFMDDEEGVRRVAEKMLRSLGCEVKSAADGAEVLREYSEAMKNEVPYDLVIMDVTVPGGMGGKEAIEKLKEINPHVKAIVSSGYSNDPVMAEYRKYGFRAVIVKPYRLDELSREVIAVLSEKP